MKIGLVIPEFSPLGGDLGPYAYELYRQLDSLGWGPVVLTTRPASLPRVASLRATGPMSFSYKVSLRSSAFVASSGVDLLHLLGGPEGVTLFTRSPVPVVYTVPSLFAHHQLSMKPSLAKALPRALRRALEKRSYHRASRLVCPWPSVEEALVNWYGASPGQVRVLPPGVDVTTYHPPDGNREPGRLLYVGSAAPHQGLHLLLQALQKVVETSPSSHLVIVEGDTFQRHQVVRWIQGLELEGSTQVIGQISQQELVAEYQKAEVLVVPSLAGGLGIRCLEAMACGLPVVGTRVHGVEDAVEDGVTGLLVPLGDVDALATSIVALLEAPERRHTLGVQGRARVEERYDSTARVRQLVSLYEEVLEEAGQ